MRGGVRLVVVAVVLATGTGCLLEPKPEFQGVWDGELWVGGYGPGPVGQGAGDTGYQLRFDFSLIVEGEFTADVAVTATDAASIGPGLALQGKAFGTVDGNEVKVRIPVRLLDDTTADLKLTGDRSELDDGSWNVRVEFLGSGGDVGLRRPIENRWDFDPDANGENARQVPTDSGY